MRKFKTALALLLTLALAVQLSTAALADDDNIQSGTCGDNLTWTLEDGVLTISGTGAMTDYMFVPHTTLSMPWYSAGSSIIAIVIEDGVTSISSYAFYGCSSLTSYC